MKRAEADQSFRDGVPRGRVGLGGETQDQTSCASDTKAEPGDFEVQPGDAAAPLCDLGGGKPAVQACFYLGTADDSCDSLAYTADDLKALVLAEFRDCGHPYSVGISCGPSKVSTADGAKCCWEMDGTCQTDREFSDARREVCADEPSDGVTRDEPAGCEDSEDPNPIFDYPWFPGTFSTFQETPASCSVISEAASPRSTLVFRY